MIASPGFASRFNYANAQSRSGLTVRKDAADREARLDAELVRRFTAEGDEAAFAEIVMRYRERMFSVGLGMLKNHADAEEVAQDTFIRAHRGLVRFRGDSTLSTWLHRIALNVARNRYWYFHRRRRHLALPLDAAFSDDNPGTAADLIASDEAGPSRLAVTSEFSALVAATMQQLGAHAREILTLRHSLDRTYEEIARELGIGLGTVKSRLARARERLRVLLAEACPEFGEGAQPAEWFDVVRPAGGVTILRG